MLSSSYNPKDHEKNIYEKWMNANVGSPEVQASTQANLLKPKTHSILMPPPNLTGNMHAGHAFQHFLMDTLSRLNRLQGKKNLWYPGVDHAGIQLEGVIDKLIKKGDFNEQIKANSTLSENLNTVERSNWPQYIKSNNRDLWFELAWSKVNEWRDNQKNQAAVLGDTPDYSRQLFTLDERANDMVSHAFNKYWEDGLLYKSSYLINWSVGLQTALSDISGEIEYEKRIDPFVTFEYRPTSFDLKAGKEDIPLLAKLHHYFDEHPIQVSTVRPETIFGDVAIAIHPSRLARNLQLAGFSLDEIAEAKRLIQHQKLGMQLGIKSLGVANIQFIIADEVDENFGSGSLKITPASDIVDYNLFNKYIGGEFPSSVGRDGKLTEVCGEYAGLAVEQGRLAVIKKLLETGYIPVKPEFADEKKQILSEVKANLNSESFDSTVYSYEEGQKRLQEMLGEVGNKLEINWNYEHNVTICERSKTVVEPLISEEFFVSFSSQAKSTQKSLQQHGMEGIAETEFYTSEYYDRAKQFLENIHDWCISRNLVWGHRIPVWYNISENPERKFYTALEISTNPQLSNSMKVQENKPTQMGDWQQEEKILDTWFSSCLWPLSTLGFAQYIESNATIENDFSTFYPTQEMTTAKEIFYLWIVRMITLGKYFTSQLPSSSSQYNTIPFQQVIITPTILDEKGRKMSKSLGNGLDPVYQIQRYSSDALRLAMLSGMIPNRNMRMGGQLADKMCEKYRNFGNKLWNVARFLDSQLDGEQSKVFTQHALSAPSLWILDKLIELEEAISLTTTEYELAHTIHKLYQFLWDYFADWYIEYLKTDKTQLNFAWHVLRQYVMLVSPFIPYETEVLWHDFFNESNLLAFATYNYEWCNEVKNTVISSESLGSTIESGFVVHPEQEMHEFEVIIHFVSSIRSVRGLFAIDPAKKIELFTESVLLHRYANFIQLVVKCEVKNEARERLYEVKSNYYHYAIDMIAYLPDIDEEINRTLKAISSSQTQMDALEKQLANPQFLERAEAEAVTEKRQNLAQREFEIQEQKEKLSFLREHKG